VINDPSKTTLRVPFWAVLETPIGESLPDSNARQGQNYTNGSGSQVFGGVEGGALGGIFGCTLGPVGCFIGALLGGTGGSAAAKYWFDEIPGHSAVWDDPVTAQVIVASVTGP
jgi:hypothetical protein